MSLDELKNNQKLMDVLDGLGLSAENRKIAEAYFDGSGEADGTLLSRLTMQDLSQLPERTDKERGVRDAFKKAGPKPGACPIY